MGILLEVFCNNWYVVNSTIHWTRPQNSCQQFNMAIPVRLCGIDSQSLWWHALLDCMGPRLCNFHNFWNCFMGNLSTEIIFFRKDSTEQRYVVKQLTSQPLFHSCQKLGGIVLRLLRSKYMKHNSHRSKILSQCGDSAWALNLLKNHIGQSSVTAILSGDHPEPVEKYASFLAKWQKMWARILSGLSYIGKYVRKQNLPPIIN